MIEKINQITNLIIVPSVDKEPKLAINQMKILNILVKLRAEAEQCNIDIVVKSLPNKYCPQCGEPITRRHKFWCKGKP